ncbi:MAG: radical SAM protein [Desulfobulbaceae bacterium]|nr:radical SAM protein [Desulfobulbaceae bacterium]HIJ77766.1 radical SAM protein [Deltaproteobacteria bacterium]
MNSPVAKTLYFKPKERNVFFHLLTACNLACRHCYINPAQHGSNTLGKETIEDWLRLFYDPQKQSNVIFLGGEPTLHPDLAHSIKYARQLGYKGITVDSNGYLHHDLLANITPEDAVISFSLDGPDPEVNDPIRGPGVFAMCTANLKKAINLGFDVSLIYTVSRLNLDHLHRMPALLAELGCKRFFIQVIGIRGKSAQEHEAKLQLTPEEWLSVIPDVARAAAAKGIHVIYPKVFLEPKEEFQCAGLVAENYFIFPNGRVYLCPLCEDFPLHSFEIDDNKLVATRGINEKKLFSLTIPEGCVMNKLLQPGNLQYDKAGTPVHRISCCLLKQEMR